MPVATGERVQQQARLRVTDRATAPRSTVRDLDAVTVFSTVVGQLPPLSLGASLYPTPAMAATAIGSGYECVLVELTDVEERWPELLATAAEQAAGIGAGLDVRLVTGDPSAVTRGVHATELPHLLDSLATQRTVVENAVRIAAGRPLQVGPVTLAPRFNAVATTGRVDPASDARQAVDPLQHSECAAAWTLASVSALSVPGVAGLTYYETAGERGLVLDHARLPGDLSPAGRVLNHLAAGAGRSVLRAEAPRDLAVLPLANGAQGVELLLGEPERAGPRGDRSVGR